LKVQSILKDLAFMEGKMGSSAKKKDTVQNVVEMWGQVRCFFGLTEVLREVSFHEKGKMEI